MSKYRNHTSGIYLPNRNVKVFLTLRGVNKGAFHVRHPLLIAPGPLRKHSPDWNRRCVLSATGNEWCPSTWVKVSPERDKTNPGVYIISLALARVWNRWKISHQAKSLPPPPPLTLMLGCIAHQQQARLPRIRFQIRCGCKMAPQMWKPQSVKLVVCIKKKSMTVRGGNCWEEKDLGYQRAEKTKREHHVLAQIKDLILVFLFAGNTGTSPT